MNTSKIFIIVIVVAVLGLGWLTLSNQDGEDVMVEKTDEATMEESLPDSAKASSGTYEPYHSDKLALAGDGKVVLFFRAPWCPTCRTLNADIRANIGNIPAGVTILDVDYDNSTALKQKYGVTYQHTFVQVDALGNQIAKWSNSPTLAAILASLK